LHELQATTRVYTAALLCLAVGLTLYLLARGPLVLSATAPATVLVAVCVTVAWLFPIQFASRTKLYVDTAVTVAAVLLLPPALATMAVAAGTLIAHAIRQDSRDWAQALFNAAQTMLVTLAAALILALSGWNPIAPSFEQPRLLLVLPILAVVMYVVNVFLVAVVTALQAARPILESFRSAVGEDFRVEATAHLSLVITGILAAMVACTYRWGVALLAVPVIATYATVQHQTRSRHAAERARIMSDAGLAEAQRLARLGSWEWLPDSDCWTWSDEVYRLLGLQPGDVLPSRAVLMDAAHHSDRPSLEQTLRQARQERQPFELEHRVLLPDGAERVVHVRAKPHDGLERPGAFLGTVQDVTERIRAEQTMRQAKEAAQEADRAKTQLLSMASHDLRTPLTAIQGYIEMVANGSAGELNDDQRDFLEVAQRNTLQLTALVNDLLDLARIEAGRLTLQVRPIDVHSSVAQALASLSPHAAEKGVELFAVDGSAGPLVDADPARLGQILQNLIGNAIKFTETGSVTVSSRTEGEWVEIAVTDTGIGIDPKVLPHIFEEFSQGGEIAKRAGGAGLGLAIVKQLTELHGGTIMVHSTLAEGSTFTLRLPRSTPPNTDEEGRDT
jgi:PAS domain S-box-containing protein